MTAPLSGRSAFSWLTVAFLSLWSGAARADEIRVLCSNGIKPVVEELLPEYERSTHNTVHITYGVSASLGRQIEGGEPFDAAILTASLVDDAIERLRIQRDSRIVLARSAMALGIRRGSSKPDVGTVEGLKSALRNASSIAYAREGASAPFVAQTLRTLGLADEMAPRIRLTDNGVQAGSMVAAGGADFCVLPTSEILPIAGIEVLGPFPDEVKGYLIMVGGVGVRALQPAVAASFLRFLVSPASAPVLARKGMERPPARP
jgi:molybdate transport system substrate-binding protein